MSQRLVPTDGAYRVEVETTRGVRAYWKGRDGTITAGNQDAKDLIREGLAFPASATGPIAHLRGWRCPDCGRRNYVKVCGRCGCPDGERE